MRKILSIFVYDTVFVSDAIVVDVFVVAYRPEVALNDDEIVHLRDVLRISIGSGADALTSDDVCEFARTLLEATAVVLRAKYASQKALLLEGYKR